MSDENNTITIDGKEIFYLHPVEKILACIKQSLRDKGKFTWGDDPTWKKAREHKSKNFGSYCDECDHTIDQMLGLAIHGISPFNMFGKENNPYKPETFCKFVLSEFRPLPKTIMAEEQDWKTAQMIAFHVVYKTNEPYNRYKGTGETFCLGQEQEIRIVSSWWYRKKVMVKTVYLNVFETDAEHRLPYVFKGTFSDDETKIIVSKEEPAST
jgi:hypothetical protein